MSTGRPPSTTHDEVERVALELFSSRGFEETTVEDIAAAVGVGRRTIFRYFPSKNDMVWGDFDWVLRRLRTALEAEPAEVPVMETVRRAAVKSNSYDVEQLPGLRIRMSLITSVPALQAHSMLRYADWRAVIAEFAAARLGADPGDLVPQTIAHASLGASMAAFRCWVEDPVGDLEACLDRAYAELAAGFSLDAERA